MVQRRGMMRQPQLKTPVLLISYNRPECTRRVLSAIRTVRPKRLYMACDGWKNEEDRKKCEEVRLLTRAISRLFNKNNLGSRNAPYEAMKWFFRNEKMGIFLEDDIVPDVTFFRFCEEVLKKYEQDKTVGCISGGNVIASKISIDSSYYFSRYSQTWGWATWRRAWKLYDLRMNRWPEMKKTRLLEKLFSNIRTRAYWTRIFDAVYTGEIQSAWDYQWTFMSWVHELVTVMPKVNMVRNIGIGVKSATHTKASNWINKIRVLPMKFPLVHPQEKKINDVFDELLQKRMYVFWKEFVMSFYRKWRALV
jgi:hypothetical protein